MTMFFNHTNKDHDHITRPKFFVDEETFHKPKMLLLQVPTFGIEVVFGDYKNATIDETYFGAIVQYPNDKGSVEDYREFHSESSRSQVLM